MFVDDAPNPSDLRNPACVSYKYDCSTLAGCKAEDNGRWTYRLISLEECKAIKVASAEYKTPKCCTVDKCNAPNPTLDPVTKIIPKPAGVAG